MDGACRRCLGAHSYSQIEKVGCRGCYVWDYLLSSVRTVTGSRGLLQSEQQLISCNHNPEVSSSSVSVISMMMMSILMTPESCDPEPCLSPDCDPTEHFPEPAPARTLLCSAHPTIPCHAGSRHRGKLMGLTWTNVWESPGWRTLGHRPYPCH